MGIKFLRAILNKTKDWIRNTTIRLELGMDEIKNHIQKNTLRCFWTCDADEIKRILKKMLHTKMKGKQPKDGWRFL